MRRLVAAGLIAGGCWLLGTGLMVPAKALLAGPLIERAWRYAQAGVIAPRPWPWMDSTPVARLVFPDQQRDYLVLRGVAGSILAFAPGWHEQTALPGSKGVAVIGGHRDTHFALLGKLRPGAPLVIERPDGRVHHYRVMRTLVLQRPVLSLPAASDEILVLTTCYPLTDWRPGGPARYVVIAAAARGDA